MTETDDLLLGLTEPQRQAVTHVDGPLLVLAGPGSGKTRVITHRVAYLVRSVGLAPWHIVAITFTNKAAAEMRERMTTLLTERQARAVNVSTFHSLCARLLRQYADRLELPPSFSIYDTADQKAAMKTALQALKISSDNFPPASVLHAISNAKNELVDPEAYARAAGDFYTKTVASVYRKYDQILTQNKALDFDDLLLKTVALLKAHPDVLAELRQRFGYILIDEYQDTNHAQFVLAHVLAAEHKNICATGDPDQAIYGWRGANIHNILEFESHYPDATVVRLEQNYRSTKSILAVADALIQNNSRRKHKTLWTDNQIGDPPKVVTCYDERHEAQWVIQQFQEIHLRQGIPWSGMAVFYRQNSLSRVMEDALRAAIIPYQIARGTSFYERKEIKDLVAYLRVVANPADEVNLLRVINVPARGISTATIKVLRAYTVGQSLTMDQVIHRPQAIGTLNTRAVNAINRFARMLDGWQAESGLTEPPAPEGPPTDDVRDDEPSLRQFVEQVLRESGLEEHYGNDPKDPEGGRLDNLGELVSSAQQFEDDLDVEPLEDEIPIGVSGPLTLAQKLTSFLEQISLISDVDTLDANEGAVTLMTLHAAKGLEFPAVAIIGVEDGLLPHHRSQESEEDIEEERRLCFVGMTRAKNLLYLTHARYRTVFGQALPAVPSRFLAELPIDRIESEDLSDQEGLAGDPYRKNLEEQIIDPYEEEEIAACNFPPGTLVRHDKFGLGRILTINRSRSQTRARVQFNTSGVKTLVLQYAPIQRVHG